MVGLQAKKERERDEQATWHAALARGPCPTGWPVKFFCLLPPQNDVVLGRVFFFGFTIKKKEKAFFTVGLPNGYFMRAQKVLAVGQ